MKILMRYFCVFFLNLYFVRAHALRVQTIFNFHFDSSRESFQQRIPLFEKYGLVFVEHDPDIVLICGSASYILPDIKKPVIVLDDGEPASISALVRNYVLNPSVKAVFKNTILQPKTLYNQARDFEVYHHSCIKKNYDKTKKMNALLSEKELDKIQCVLWDNFRSAFRQDLMGLKEAEVNFSAERPIDVFFAGTVIGAHRKKVIQVLNKFKKKYKNVLNIVVHNGLLPKDEYLQILRRSKIAVSPWGAAEWCWRDFEAMYSGAVVIKPDTHFVQASPDLYKNDIYYVSCKPDLSDLDRKIFSVITNYSNFITMRTDARQLLIDYWNEEKLAKDFVEAVKKVAL